jgi:aminoglycoside phosphotransferase family enzyme
MFLQRRVFFQESKMSKDVLPAYIQYLQESGSYSHPAEDVQLLQTHISFVLLAGDFVYKWKKPVNFGFLDFSTLEKRKFYCEQELILNRRLCPELYLDVVTLNRAGEQFALNGQGEVVEYGVKMARMPEERMMARVIAAGLLDRGQIDRIIEVLVPFYQRAEGSEEINGFGRAASVAINVLENFAQTEPFVDGGAFSRAQFTRIREYAADFLRNEQLFERRLSAGKIRDCHGDLYSANICLTSPVAIFDCIEFNERFRYADVASDVAFLAMDLEFHGLDELSAYFIDRFVAESADPALVEMLDFYKCYRAMVRGKINLFTAGDPAVDAAVAAHCQEQAARYFALAQKYAVRAEGQNGG